MSKPTHKKRPAPEASASPPATHAHDVAVAAAGQMQAVAEAMSACEGGAPFEPSAAAGLADISSALTAVQGLLTLLILAILGFHPWFRAGVERVVDLIPLLVLVLIFVYVALPVVAAMRRVLARHVKGQVSEERALLMTYIILLGVVAIVLALVVPRLVHEAQSLADDLPAYSKAAREKMLEYRERLDTLLPDSAQAKLSEMMGDVGNYAGGLLRQGLTYVGVFSQTLVWVLSAVVVVPMLGYYFLKDAEGILEFQLRLVNERSRGRVRAILLGMHEAMQNYVRGQAFLCAVMGVVTALAMLLILPQFAIGLGIVAGITEAIPVVGPILGAVPAIIIALASKGWVSAVIVALAYTGLQQLESVALVPRVMGEKLGLHPLSLLVGMMFFGNLFGFWGVLLASPLVAAVKVLVTELLEHPANVPVVECESGGAVEVRE